MEHVQYKYMCRVCGHVTVVDILRYGVQHEEIHGVTCIECVKEEFLIKSPEQIDLSGMDRHTVMPYAKALMDNREKESFRSDTVGEKPASN